MRVFLFILTILASLLCFACSKKRSEAELKYSIEEFTLLVHAASFKHEKEEMGLSFSDYNLGVNRLESRTLVYQRLIFFAISFENTNQAKAEALRLNQYYARNWLFDRVEGEPILEDYVIETFHATNPLRKIQRIPKGQSNAHGNTHGEAPHH